MIVFDLDGTLALDHHRRHHLLKDPKDWDSYFRACGDDEPNSALVELVRMIWWSGGFTLGLWSGRSASVNVETLGWLDKHQLTGKFHQTRFRSADDRTEDTELKRSWLHQQNATGDPVTLVFEDRQRVVDMWRSEGITCCQVAPGDF